MDDGFTPPAALKDPARIGVDQWSDSLVSGV
jgi:hypothetical protein